VHSLRKFLRTERIYLLFILPTAVFLVLFLFYPLIAGIPVAFTDWDGFSKTRHFVGIDNFKRFFRDLSLARDLRNTILFTILETLFCNIIGLVLALLYQKPTKLNGILKSVVFMPFVVSLVLSSYMIQILLYEVCEALQITNPLAITSLVIPGLSIVAIWRDSGYCMIVYIAALSMVDLSLYEAAVVEGAGGLVRFFKITVPMIIPAFTANVTLLLSWGLKLFDYSMTTVKGYASESINVYVYSLIFAGYRAGYGQAIALVWLLAIFIITNFVSKMLRKREVEV
jgi:raffinose/stachyose/melibiose transport system permease protein